MAVAVPTRVRRLPSGEGLLRYFRTLSVMHSSGISLVRALRLLEQDADLALAGLCHSLGDQLQEGRALSEAMQRCEGIFSPYQLASVVLGEKNGRLDVTLRRLAEIEQQRLAIQQRLRGALLQPALTLMLAVVGLVLFLPGFVFRAYLQLIENLQIPESGTFAAVLGLMRATQQPIFWLAIGGVLATLSWIVMVPAQREVFCRSLLQLLQKVPRLGHYFQGLYARGRSWEGLLAGGEALILASPWGRSVGRSLQAATSARFASALAGQLEVGIPALSAVKPSAQASGSLLMRLHERTLVHHLEAGETLSLAISRVQILSPLLAQMVKVGEESGKLPELLYKVAEFHRQEMEHSLETALALLEPLVISILGLILGGFALLMLYPIAKVVESL